jgi:hypothetical protein
VDESAQTLQSERARLHADTAPARILEMISPGGFERAPELIEKYGLRR